MWLFFNEIIIYVNRYYHDVWLNENISRQAPHQDEEISSESSKCLKRYYPNPEERRAVSMEYTRFSNTLGAFADPDSLRDRRFVNLKCLWVLYGSSTPNLQVLALKLQGQSRSSSCCERNWNTNSFIHSLKRNKLTPAWAEDLVYVHNNFRLISQNLKEYNEEKTKMWDINGDGFDSFQGVGVLNFATLSLDEPMMEVVLFADDGKGDNEEVVGLASTSSWDMTAVVTLFWTCDVKWL